MTTASTESLQRRIRSGLQSVSDEVGPIEMQDWTGAETRAVGLALIKLYALVRKANDNHA